MRIDERKQKVLAAIIKDYVATAEPVGSRTIARKYNLGVSPATIRNEMADLEEMGLIEQPHTSAGRIPSHRGYRYYVDCLMERQQLTEEEENYIRQAYMRKMREIDSVIQETSRLLSELTNYTSMVLSPQASQSEFKHIELIPFQPLKALAVIITQAGFVLHRIMDISESITAEDLRRVAQVFNNKLKGVTLENLKKSVWQDLYNELLQQKRLLREVMELLQDALQEPGEEKVYLGGTLNMLNQPEFRNVDKIKHMLAVLEENQVLKSVLDTASRGITVKIGGENSYEELQECSVITATYEVDGKIIGKIGVLGPTRMEYSKAVSIVDFMTKTLSEVLSKFYGM
ncbi:MAG: heat-inducible transcription repressor HrcA [Firmicutes bacterium]|nr:heat-inducible transcription repressor HrcA [Bacillota bacterium]